MTKEDPPETKPSGNDPDVDTLRQEYLSLHDELFKSRARANAVASQLYSTRIPIAASRRVGPLLRRGEGVDPPRRRDRVRGRERCDRE